MSKRIVVLLVLVMLIFSYIPVFADEGDNGVMLGMVPVKGSVSAEGGGNLSYHGGPVMLTNKVYAIYWLPSGYTMASGYQSLITRYFTDVAAVSGVTSNVYYSDTQYYSISGGVHHQITYNSTFGGSYVDTGALPASGCALYSGLTDCLTDAQIQAEINRVITLKHWVRNAHTEFFMFTANGIGSCFGSSCAFTDYCAYHSYAGQLLYSNMPYTGTNLGACGVPYSPNNNFDADSTLSVVSHEHNETITDPRGTGWWNTVTGNENGDQCAWNFGAAVSPSHKFNQTINGHHYILQQEWSNKTVRCVLKGL